MPAKTIESKDLQSLLKASQIADKLCISRAFAYKLMQTGEIRTVKILGAVRVRLEDLDEYILANVWPTVGE